VRTFLLGICLLGLAAPVAAAPYSDEDDDRRALPPQEELERGADKLHRVLDALMDIRVGPLVDAVDPEGARDRYRRDETLGEMAARDDPYYRERMHDSIEGATAGMSGMIARLALITPVLERSLEDVERSIEDAMDNVPEGGRY
jgi:hypothetical protein